MMPTMSNGPARHHCHSSSSLAAQMSAVKAMKVPMIHMSSRGAVVSSTACCLLRKARPSTARATVPGTILRCHRSQRALSSSNTFSLSSLLESSFSSYAACISPGNKDLCRAVNQGTHRVVMVVEAATTMMIRLLHMIRTRETMVLARRVALAPLLRRERLPRNHNSKVGGLGSGLVLRQEQPQAMLQEDTTTATARRLRLRLSHMPLSALLEAAVSLAVLVAEQIHSLEALRLARPPHQASRVVDTSRRASGVRVDDEVLDLWSTASQCGRNTTVLSM
jgi:hypothetical protein